MADFYGMSRTNYFKIEGEYWKLIELYTQAGFNAEIETRGENIGKFCAYREDQYPYFSAIDRETDEDIDLIDETGKYLVENEVAMFGTWGNMKARYGSGSITAIMKKDGKVLRKDLEAEYKMREIISEAWDIDTEEVSLMQY